MFPHSRLHILGAISTLLVLGAAPALGASPDPGSIAGASPSSAPVASLVAASPIPSPSAAPCLEPSPSPSGPVPEASTASPEPSSEVVGVASPLASSLPLASPALSPQPSLAPCVPEDPRVGLGVGPSQVILSADQRTGTFSVYNAGDLAETITLSARDFTFDATGQRVVSDVPSLQGAASWLTIDPITFDLEPEQSQTVTFTLTVPRDATPGDHVADIRVVGGFTTEAWDRFYREHPKADAVSVRSRVSFGVDVVARVPGEIIPRVVVPPFEAFLPNLVLSMDGQIAFTPTIRNEGNVAAAWMPVAGTTSALGDMIPMLTLKATGGLFARSTTLFDGTVSEGGRVNLSPLIVLPGTVHTQHLMLTDAPLFGTYDYQYTLPGSVVDGREAITAVGSFTVINVQKVLTWVVLPLIVLLLLMGLIVLRRHHVDRRRRIAATVRARELQQARQEAYEQAWREQQARFGDHR